MSQDPKSKLSSAGLDFTPRIHNDTYDFINPSQFDLSGRAVFITGASKGVGRCTALSYARAGASRIAIGARSSQADLADELRDAARKAGRAAPEVLQLELDVTSAESVGAAAERIAQSFGRLDVVVNNAGYLETFVPIADSDPDEWWRVYTVNVRGPYLVTRAALPLLLGADDGLKTLVNVSSVGANVIMPGASGYQTGKLALVRFSEFVNVEYGARGVLAYAVHPGGVETELASRMPRDMHGLLTDKPGLAADSFVWLTAERRPWLAGRYISCTWDMEDLLGKREKIERDDLLKIRLDVGVE